MRSNDRMELTAPRGSLHRTERVEAAAASAFAHRRRSSSRCSAGYRTMVMGQEVPVTLM
jgi:hypothetical protein